MDSDLDKSLETALDIGLDIGGTSVKAWHVRREPEGLTVVAGVERRWLPTNVVGRVQPLDLRAMQAGTPRDAREFALAGRLITTAVDCIAELVGSADGQRRPTLGRLGIATAGPKTEDERGIGLWLNGPRNPLMLDELLDALAARGLAPASPPERLLDDGLAGARGEQVAVEGALPGVATALYFAPGTDLAEAFVRAGRVGPRPSELAAYWEARSEPFQLERLVELGPSWIARRAEELATVGWPALERIVIGARGGERLSQDGELRDAFLADLPSELRPRLVCSKLRAAPALGSLAPRL